ncbi:hypothetical protein DFH08DRAFT_796923 [Mycena albidolilacea]|uniref:Uncharacterized protein n=1 Tax=Mycena albidolilacea TaxID=1033008 RepID=A0AAD7F7W3_9AGAR|nr:hypothetical protein DFH08DRAFT_796923 [Mycena albidolilacea]
MPRFRRLHEKANKHHRQLAVLDDFQRTGREPLMVDGIGSVAAGDQCRCQQRPLAHDRTSRIQGENVANRANIRGWGFGFWIGGWGCVPRTREEEPDSGVFRTGVPTGSKTEGSRSQGKRQRVGVMVLSSERGAKARPEQRDEDKSTPGSSPRTKHSSQTSRGHQGVMSIKESTGGTQGTPVAIQECSHLGRDIRSEYPPT